MNERNAGRISFLGKLCVIIAFSAVFYLIVLIEDRQIKAETFDKVDHLAQMTRILREKTSLDGLQREIFFGSIANIEKVDESTAEKIAARLINSSGAAVMFAVWSAKGELLVSRGLKEPDLNDLKLVMLNRMHIEEGSDILFDSSQKALSRLFASIPPLYRIPGQFFAQSVNFKGKPCSFCGGLISGNNCINTRIVRFFVNRDTHGRPDYPPVEQIPVNGMIAVILPKNALKSAEAISKVLDSSVDRKSLEVTVCTSETIDTAPIIHDALKSKMREMIAEGNTQGEIISDEFGSAGLAFVSLEGSGFIDNERLIAIYQKKYADSFRFSRFPPFLVVLLVLALFFIRGISIYFTSGRNWNMKLFGKFLCLSLLACLGPMTSLTWIAFSQNLSSKKIERIEMFNELETSIFKLENRHKKYLSENIIQLKKFIDGLLEGEMSSGTAILKRVQKLFPYQVENVFIQKPGSSPEYFCSQEKHDESMKKNWAGSVQSWLTYTLNGLKLADARQTGGTKFQQDELKGELITREIMSTMGPRFIHYFLDMVVNNGVLTSFKVLTEVTWSFLHLAYTKNGALRYLIFAIMNRKYSQFGEVLTWIFKDHCPHESTPPFLYVNILSEHFPDILPLWAFKHPILLHMLIQTQKEGAGSKITLDIDGRQTACLTQPLKGMDFVAMALKPIEERTNYRMVIFQTAALLYPVVFVLLGAFFFKRSIINPVRELSAGVESLAKGNLSCEIPALTDDEIGDLCKSFNKMAAGLREKEFLQRFLSDLARDAVSGANCGKATRTNASILFTDIRGFTGMSEKNPPYAIVQMLIEYMTKSEEIIERHGGTIEKFIGDAVMAVFLPMHGKERPAIRAIKAALELKDQVLRLNAFRKRTGMFTFDIGAGIASGVILMGILGRTDGRREFTVTGPTVNVAAKMEKLTKHAVHTGVVICPETLSSVSGLVAATSIKMEDIQGYEIITFL